LLLFLLLLALLLLLLLLLPLRLLLLLLALLLLLLLLLPLRLLLLLLALLLLLLLLLLAGGPLIVHCCQLGSELLQAVCNGLLLELLEPLQHLWARLCSRRGVAHQLLWYQYCYLQNRTPQQPHDDRTTGMHLWPESSHVLELHPAMGKRSEWSSSSTHHPLRIGSVLNTCT
jgi:hypothetical protein